VSEVLGTIGDGLGNAFEMAWEVWWALILGFALSGIVQAWVSHTSMERVLGGRSLKATLRATGLGAASSSCSYAAIAIAKSTFQKGAGLPAAVAFMFASTNLVFELGIVLWIFLGPAFTAAEFAGGFALILLMWAAVHRFVSHAEEEQARAHARAADTGHAHAMASGRRTLREQLTSAQAWSDVAHNFRGDWQMLWKEMTAGFVIAGFVALLPSRIFEAAFITDAPPAIRTVENVIVGPLIAILSFVCSVGNVPLAAVLWSGGISIAGVIAFIFADLIVLPIISAYRKYYGTAFALRITALMFVTMVIAALIIDGLFSGLGLIPTVRPSRDDIFGSVKLDYNLVLNVLGLAVFVALFWLTVRRGVTDPVCGMKVDRSKAITKEFGGETFYFCSEHCLHAFEAEPERYAPPSPPLASQTQPA
jgi:uncharacterized membrane protein YraQ (UPF0718 family)/YHS domain-containing protein